MFYLVPVILHNILLRVLEDKQNYINLINMLYSIIQDIFIIYYYILLYIIINYNNNNNYNIIYIL